MYWLQKLGYTVIIKNNTLDGRVGKGHIHYGKNWAMLVSLKQQKK